MKDNLVEDWLNSVACSHSQSKATEVQYKRVWERFSNDIEITAIELLLIMSALMIEMSCEDTPEKYALGSKSCSKMA